MVLCSQFSADERRCIRLIDQWNALTRPSNQQRWNRLRFEPPQNEFIAVPFWSKWTDRFRRFFLANNFRRLANRRRQRRCFNRRRWRFHTFHDRRIISACKSTPQQ